MQEDNTSLSVFKSPGQQQLFRRLYLFLGPGPAAYYRDACRLLATDPAFDATTHLVMHLMREIEGMLLDVLFPLAEAELNATQESAAALKARKVRAEDAKANHAMKIEVIGGYLGVGQDDALVQAWLKRSSKGGEENRDALHKRAHRDNLAAPRPADDEFLTYVEETERLFDGILQRFEPKYSVAVRQVDQLIARQRPTLADVKTLRQRVPNTPALLNRFFDAIDTPSWLPHLEKEEFFARPPGPQRDVDSGEIVGYSTWPASRYLVRLAQRGVADPRMLLAIVTSIIDTPNPFVLQDLLEILLTLPANDTADLIPRIVGWIEEH